MSKRNRLQADLDDFDQAAKRVMASLTEIQRAEEQPRNIHFGSWSSSAWHVLNKKYSSSSGSREYDNSWNATSEVEAMITYIQTEATKPNATFSTKQSALETLRKIGKSITLAPSTLGSEVVKQFEYNFCLENAMRRILVGMTVGQIRRVAESADEKGMFVEKVEELCQLGKDMCIFENLEKVLDLLDAAIALSTDLGDLPEPVDRVDEVQQWNESGDEGDD